MVQIWEPNKLRQAESMPYLLTAGVCTCCNGKAGWVVIPADGCGSAVLLGLRFRLGWEQGINGLLRVFDYQPFFLRSPLAFRWLLLRHTMVLSYRFSNGGIPQPGIEPGSPEWATACKAAPSASSGTGGSKALNVGTGDPSKCAVPTCSRPNSAALNSSSYRSSSNGSKRNSIGVVFRPVPLHHGCLLIRRLLYFSFFGQAGQYSMDRSRWVLLGTHIKTRILKHLHNFLSANLGYFLCHQFRARFGDSHRVSPWLLTTHRSQGRYCALKSCHLSDEASRFSRNFIHACLLLLKRGSRLFESRAVHKDFVVCHIWSISVCQN